MGYQIASLSKTFIADFTNMWPFLLMYSFNVTFHFLFANKNFLAYWTLNSWSFMDDFDVRFESLFRFKIFSTLYTFVRLSIWKFVDYPYMLFQIANANVVWTTMGTKVANCLVMNKCNVLNQSIFPHIGGLTPVTLEWFGQMFLGNMSFKLNSGIEFFVAICITLICITF